MAFRTPSVRVYQELLSTTASLTTPFFELCVVGPAYQCVEKAAVPDYNLSVEDYEGSYVNQTVGSIVDPSSLQIFLSDVYVKVWPLEAKKISDTVVVDNDGPVTTVTGTDELEFSESSIEVGDYIDITYTSADETLTYSAAIQEVSDDGKTITLKRNLPSPDEGAKVTAVVKRATKEDDMELESQFFTATASKFTIATDAQVSTSVIDAAATVVSASMTISYRALRKDIANDFLTITSQSVAEAKLGSVNINNPLSVAASIIANVVGSVTYKVLPIQSDDKNGYLKALDILTMAEKVYVIVPLSDDKDVVSAYAAHCKAMSEPEESNWRVTYCSQPMPTTKVMIELNDGKLSQTDTNLYIKDTANGMFVTNNARVTDFADIYNAKNVYQYSLQVLDVLNDSVAEVDTLKWVRTSEGYVETEETLTLDSKLTDVRYEIVRVLDTQGVADAIGGIADSFKNKRLRLVYPDTIMLNVNSVDELTAGYYLCVALGAMRAAYPPHQGFSTMGISGIKRVLNANKLFTKDQLAEMAGNGVFWVCQDEPEELPYVLYQTTTDNTQLETAEDSCVAVVDYASKFYKDNLKNVLGKYNVNTISLNYVKTIINACSDTMTSTSYQYIGPILTSATLVSLESEADKIKPTVKVEIPYPVNAVDLYLQV